MWKREDHEAGAILTVLSRGRGRLKKGALKASHQDSPALLTATSSAPRPSVCSSPHILPFVLIVCSLVSPLLACGFLEGGKRVSLLFIFSVDSTWNTGFLEGKREREGGKESMGSLLY